MSGLGAAQRKLLDRAAQTDGVTDMRNTSERRAADRLSARGLIVRMINRSGIYVLVDITGAEWAHLKNASA